MQNIPKPQEIYKHFKGNMYQIITIAHHSETMEKLVIYQALYGDFKIYARPLEMFLSEVDHQKYPEVKQKFRFERLTDIENTGTCNANAQTVLEEPRSGVESIEIQRVSNEVQNKTEEKCVQGDEEFVLDPMVVEFLEADNYEERLNILAAIHHRVTDEMITTMAIACDVEVGDGDIEDRFNSLKNCIMTLQKFECNRLR